MNRNRKRSGAVRWLLALMFLLPPSPVHSDTTDIQELEELVFWDDDFDARVGQKLSHLFRYVGTYNIEPIFEDPYVNSTLKRLLGDQYAHLLRNLQVRGPIDFASNVIVIAGNLPHEAHRESAMVAVDLNGEISVAIRSEHTVHLFTYHMAGVRNEDYPYRWLNFEIRAWLGTLRMTWEEPRDPCHAFACPPRELVWQKVTDGTPMFPGPESARPGHE